MIVFFTRDWAGGPGFAPNPTILLLRRGGDPGGGFFFLRLSIFGTGRRVPTAFVTRRKKRLREDGDRVAADGGVGALPLAAEILRRVYTLRGEANLLAVGAEGSALLAARGACWTTSVPLDPCQHGAEVREVSLSTSPLGYSCIGGSSATPF
jgi:hypothetical protein